MMKYLLIYAVLLAQTLVAADNAFLYRCTGDIFFVMDSSASIWQEDFNQQLKFVKDLVDTFQIGENESQVRVGVITFNDIARLKFSFDRYTTRDEVKEAISQIKYEAGETNTAAALRLLQEELAPYIGSSNRTLIAVVITDGRSINSEKTKEEALKIHKLGIKVHAIGVGSRYDMNELRSIASSERNIHEVTSYAALTGIAKIFRDRLCIEETTTRPPTTTPIPTTPAATTTTEIFPTTLQRLITSPLLMTATVRLAHKGDSAIDNYAPASHAQISYASVNSVQNGESKAKNSPRFTKPIPSSTNKDSHSKNLDMAVNGTQKSITPSSKNFDKISSFGNTFQLSDAVRKADDNKRANSLTKTGRKERSELAPESPTILPILQFQQIKSYQSANTNEKEITSKKTTNFTTNEFDIESVIDGDFETDVDSDSDFDGLAENTSESTKINTKAKKKPAKPKKNKKSKSKKKRPNKKNKTLPKSLPTASSEVSPWKKTGPDDKSGNEIVEGEVEYVVEPTEAPKKDKKSTPKEPVSPTKKPKYDTKEHKEYEEDTNSDTVIFGFDYLSLGEYRTKMIFKFINLLLPNKSTGYFGVVTNSYLPKDYSIPLSPFTKRKNYNFTKDITLRKSSGTIGVIKRMGDILYKKGVEDQGNHFKRLIGVLFIDPSVTNITPDMLIEANAFKDSGFEMYLVSVGKRRWRNIRALVSLSTQPHSKYLINIPTYQYLVDNVAHSQLLQKVFAVYKRKS
ncbi:Hypothetical predicted protein [Octopus vulgaris]|uniref:VWFA domain-containing protein n=2 Tax=Octopus vulgaris TaxID=6645 RepID=A0AA36F0U1_OCTVU|nr:Hypothetical predicted protein [Octopus vulgaris]